MATSSVRQVKVSGTTQPENLVAMKSQIWRYLPLQKAALRGNWESALRFFKQDKGAVTARITANLQTALHLAVGAGDRAIHFVENLAELMPAEALAQANVYGETPLHTAAWVGNTKAAVILVEKHPALLNVPNKYDFLPVHWAARNAHKDTLEYLLPLTKDLADQSAVKLLLFAIESGFYDVALNLVRRYPEVAVTTQADSGESALPAIAGTTSREPDSADSALRAIAGKASAFASSSGLNSWQRLIYSYVPVKLDNYTKDHPDIENPVDNYQVIAKKNSWAQFLWGNFSSLVSQEMHSILWKGLELLVPHIKHIREQKLMHLQALQLVKWLCEKIMSLDDLEASSLLSKDALLLAAKLGIHEVIEEIVDSFPSLAWSRDPQNRNIFQLAVIYRCENIFNLMYQMSEHRQYVTQQIDDSGNTILHLAGRLAPPNKLNLIPGAALQMQRELQWFKEVEKFVQPIYVEWENKDNETPAMVFTKEHKELVVQGEKWMKDTSNSCTIAAALIATVVFAAAITVPGGNNGTNGLPIFSNEKAFTIFAISDAISLFTSITALLMFLSILTSRYAEGDFLYVLPQRLIIGLLMLFLSITAMTLAFGSIIYLVFGQNKAWILISVAASACLPITSFVFLQFPLLVDLVSSTYGPGIFGKQSDRPLY